MAFVMLTRESQPRCQLSGTLSGSLIGEHESRNGLGEFFFCFLILPNAGRS
jgi:hypothetical protein